MDPIAEIKNRIAIEDLVSQYVPLKKVGRQFKALCPFHKERTPSFYVSPERQLAYCFGCRKGGDHFKFIQEIEGMDFRGALEMLAEKAGVTLPKKIPVPSFQKSERDRMFSLHEEAAKYFEQKLLETDQGQKVLKYLKKRGLKEDEVRALRIGFAPEEKSEQAEPQRGYFINAPGGRNLSLYTWLLTKNFSREEILSSGLAIARDTEKNECVDRFRMRLIIPLKNLAGAICAFAGRAVREGDEPKYLNSPETSIYSKRRELFNLFDSRQEIRKKDFAVLVEGYMDVFALRREGYTNVVACSGTALTPDQLAILKRFTKHLVLSLDRDASGISATERAAELALEQDFSVRVCSWKSSAKDPDECLRDDPKEFERALESAPQALQYLLDQLKEEFDPKTIHGKRDIFSRLLPILNHIKSPIELDQWFKQIANSLSLSIQSLYDEFKQFQLTRTRSVRFSKQEQKFPPSILNTAQENTSPAKGFKIEEYLIGLLLTFPEFISIVNPLVKYEDFEDIQLQNIYRSLTSEYNLDLDVEAKALRDILAIFTETKTENLADDRRREEVQAVVNHLLRQKLEAEKRGVVSQMKAAEGERKKQLLETYHRLLLQEEKYHKGLWQRS